MPRNRTLATGISYLFLFLLIATLATRFWLSEKAYDYSGPTHITAGEDQIYLFAAGDIFRLSPSGELLDVISADRAGLTDDPIDLRLLTDGQLLIAEQRPASIRACRVDDWQCRPLGIAARSIVQKQFKVLAVHSPGDLLLTDASGDTLWQLPHDDAEPRELLPAGTLSGPNDLVFDAAGNLWVADTDHRRIVELRPAADGTFTIGREHSAVNSLTVGERYYPMMLARSTDNKLWVIQAADFSKPLADLVVYDAEEGAKKRIAMPAGAYPTDLVTVGNAVLVTDLERFVVYRVDAVSGEVSEFGDSAFRHKLAQISENRQVYNRLGTGSLAVMVLFAALMILAASFATPKAKRWTRLTSPLDPDEAPAQVPRIGEVHWLERDPKVDRNLKRLEWLGFVLPVTLAAMTLALFLWMWISLGQSPEMEAKLNELGIVLFLCILSLLLSIPFIRLSLSGMKHKLGTDGKRLHIRLAEGRELAVDFAQLAYTDRAIFYRQYILPLLNPKRRSLYAEGEVETWLAPLLRQSRRLSAMQAVRQEWKNNAGKLLWLLIALLPLLLVYLLTAVKN
jgi:hypothetical protein